MVRIVGMYRPYKITDSTKDPSEIYIYDYEEKCKKKVRVDSLKEYSPLKPDGIATFSVVNIKDNKGKLCKDVIVTATKYDENTTYVVEGNEPLIIFQSSFDNIEEKS